MGFGSAVYSFLGGTAFRLLLTFITERIQYWQEFKFETERLKLQNQIENDQAKRHIEILEAQKKAGIQLVEAEISKESNLADITNFQFVVKDATKPTGFIELDFWNSAIRPALATICTIVWIISLIIRGWILTPWDLELIAAVLGIFVGSRISHTGR
jgi:hypothetical protein